MPKGQTNLYFFRPYLRSYKIAPKILLQGFCFVLFCFVLFWTRDAKGRKVSGNFGNFPWKVSGILKGWEFSEILGIFNCDLFSTFYEIVCTKINRTEFSLHFIQTYLFCTTFLTVCWFVWVHRKNHKALLWNNIRSNLLSFHEIKYLECFSTLFLGFQKKLQIKKKKNKTWLCPLQGHELS